MIAQLGEADLPALVAHILRHGDESGRGDPIFRPRAGAEDLVGGNRHQGGWSQALDEPYWLRTWGVVVGGNVRGHLDLQGGRLASEAHRAMLGMGVERGWRGQGHGRALIAAAIAWARDHQLAWLDLCVFAHNTRARALYRAVGFVEVGTTVDRYRVEGVVVDDVAMVLRL